MEAKGGLNPMADSRLLYCTRKDSGVRQRFSKAGQRRGVGLNRGSELCQGVWVEVFISCRQGKGMWVVSGL